MGNCGTMLVVNAMVYDPRPAARPPGMDDNTYRSMEYGRRTTSLFDFCLIGGFSLGVYSLVLAGGLQMRNLRHRWLALAVSVVAAFPSARRAFSDCR